MALVAEDKSYNISMSLDERLQTIEKSMSFIRVTQLIPVLLACLLGCPSVQRRCARAAISVAT